MSEQYIIIDRDLNLLERSVSDRTKAETINDILRGQVTDVAHVYCINTAEGTCRDVSEDIARDVMLAAFNDSEPLGNAAYDFVDSQISDELSETADEYRISATGWKRQTTPYQL